MAVSILLAGCSTISKTSPPSSQLGQQSQQIALPTATVGSSYEANISILAARAPHSLAVTQGELPPGLSLSPFTTSITGIPTKSGSFAFTLAVTMLPSAEVFDVQTTSITQAYTVVVNASAPSPSIQISPTDSSLAAGGKLQFTATVKNTSNTAVTWSASAGTITSQGLFTAPSGSAGAVITVTATSAAKQGLTAGAEVTLSKATANLAITTTRVPDAIESQAYSETLDTQGGQPPYQWSIVSGSIPPGLQLTSSTGIISGAATQAGLFTWTVSVTDGSSQHAQQVLSLNVSASSNCGPPNYCSRTDLKVVQLPSSPPNLGGLTGANLIAIDPNFANQIVRITDWNTDPGMADSGRSFVTTSSGSSNANIWNLDSTLFVVQAVGAAAYPFSFNPSTLQASRLYVASNPNNGGLRLSNGGFWSRLDANLLYTTSGTTLSSYDFSDRANAPSPKTVYNFASSPNCLPKGFQETWSTQGGVSAGDTAFGMAFSNTGDQGTGVWAVSYTPGRGCSAINTQTGRVTGDWGATGTINIPDRWTIHETKISLDGNWMMISPTNCMSYSCFAGPYFWQIGTTNVTACGQGKRCSGHSTQGYSHFVNNPTTGDEVIRPFAEPASLIDLGTNIPTGLQTPFDNHPSWNNADSEDSVPFLMSTWSTISPFPAAWYNEIVGVSVDGSGRVWRFAHNFITTKSQIFDTQYGIGSVSQDGRFFIWSSDWMGTLGSQSGRQTCTIGQDCRGDVFVVQLQ